MHEPPLPPPEKDWQSPEVGDAIRIILDVWEAIGMPQPEVRERFARLERLAQEEPGLTVSAFFGLLNAALGLPALLPLAHGDEPEVRRQIEQKVYADIDEMPPPPS